MSSQKNSKKIFVIQKHNASHLHYDFRLEKNKKLKSWAIPKTPPKQKNLKRLAVQVPDHDLDYANFEGEIKQGYGKGSVKIWDSGFYEEESWKNNKIVFNLNGKKLKGKYVLLNAKLSGKKENWLFFKTE